MARKHLSSKRFNSLRRGDVALNGAAGFKIPMVRPAPLAEPHPQQRQ
jgi:hypothetical protein